VKPAAAAAGSKLLDTRTWQDESSMPAACEFRAQYRETVVMRTTWLALFTAWLAPVALVAHAAPAFKHIVIVYQENRTPDNIFGSNPGFEPGVDIQTYGVNSLGQTIQFTPVALDGCYDIAHTHTAFEAMLTQGADQEKTKLDKKCTLPPNPQFKYIDNSTGAVQPYFDIATNYGFANRMYQTNQGPSFPSHQFIFGGTSSPTIESPLFASENMGLNTSAAGCIGPTGQTVALIDSFGNEHSNAPIFPCFERPTMGDLLGNSGISWRYYAPTPGSIWTAPDAISHICVAALKHGKLKCTGSEWTDHVVPRNSAQVLTDIENCDLRAVSWVIPNAEESDHAAINKGLGPAWVATIVNTIGQQATCPDGENYWNDTAILISWDDWGGWYDHVAPLAVNVQVQGGQPQWGDGYTFGFRVPLLVVSAYTQAGTVSNTPYDFGSVLYFIEQNFGLGFIGPCDTIFSCYADYQAQSRGPLSDFFNLGAARSFVPIPTKMKAKDFIDAPPSNLPPDDD